MKTVSKEVNWQVALKYQTVNRLTNGLMNSVFTGMNSESFLYALNTE